WPCLRQNVAGKTNPAVRPQPRVGQFVPSGPRSQSRQLKTSGSHAVVSFPAQKETDMKPNGKYFVVRALGFAVCAVALFSGVGNGETVCGKFKLPAETRWGMVVLAPGEYEFTFDSDGSSRIVRVQSTDSRWSAMVMARALSDAT